MYLMATIAEADPIPSAESPPHRVISSALLESLLSFPRLCVCMRLEGAVWVDYICEQTDGWEMFIFRGDRAAEDYITRPFRE